MGAATAGPRVQLDSYYFLFDRIYLLFYVQFVLMQETIVSNVLDLPGRPEAAMLPHQRLLWLSRGLSVLFTGLIGLSAFWMVASFVAVFFFANHILVGAEGANVSFPAEPAPIGGMIRLSTQPFITRFTGFIDILIGMAPVMFVCWHLRGLFRLYAQGIVFARENAQHLKRLGLWLVVWPIAKFVANMLFQLAGGTDTAWAQMIFVYSFLLGLIVFAIALVMEFGREIEQDRDSFI